MDMQEWFVQTYDDVVRESGADRLDHRMARKLVIERYTTGVDDGTIEPFSLDPETLTGWMFDQTVKPIRNARRSQMRQSMQVLLDVLAGETTLDQNAPILDYAYMIGDGTDKVLRYWAQEDWIESAMERYRNSAAVVRAASDHDDRVQQIVSEMKDRNAILTGDLFA